MPLSDRMKMTGRLLAAALFASLLTDPSYAQPQSPETSAAPSLSPAQAALFDTPHLANVTTPETLHYAYHRSGPDSFDDTVSVRVKKANPDGTHDLSFDYLSGPHQVRFPDIDGFHANPVLMLALENDVTTMHDALHLAEAALRNRIRAGFLDATVTAGTTTLPDGTPTPAQIITMQPFAHEQRLQALPALQQKTYRFVLAPAIPGQIAEIDIAAPADPALGAPAMSERLSFTGVTPGITQGVTP